MSGRLRRSSLLSLPQTKKNQGGPGRTKLRIVLNFELAIQATRVRLHPEVSDAIVPPPRLDAARERHAPGQKNSDTLFDGDVGDRGARQRQRTVVTLGAQSLRLPGRADRQQQERQYKGNADEQTSGRPPQRESFLERGAKYTMGRQRCQRIRAGLPATVTITATLAAVALVVL